MRINQINQLFSDFDNLNVLIVGDVMIDTYYSGHVDRISPEAPVPIVAVKSEEHRLGGAANVALNIKAMSATPIICTVIGNDSRGKTFLELCENQGIRTTGVVQSDSRITTVKTRIIGNNHQLLRVDSEQLTELDSKQSEMLFNRFKEILETEKIDVIIYEDYDKGVLTDEFIGRSIALAKSKKIPTTADPKKKHFLSYKGITLFKPNLKELKEGLKVEFENSRDPEFHKAAAKLKEELDAQIIFITLSDEGVYYKSGNEEFSLPAHLRNIADVSGAGDTVISVASLCLALGQDGHILAHLSNLAGGLVCEKVGVVPIEKDLLFQEAISSIKID